MVKRLREVPIFVDNEYCKCDAIGVKNSLQKLVMMGYITYATEPGYGACLNCE